MLSCSNGIFSGASWINKKPTRGRLRCWKHNGRHEFPTAALRVAMSMSPSHPLHPECQRGGPHWCKVTTATAGAQTSGQHRHGLSKLRVPMAMEKHGRPHEVIVLPKALKTRSPSWSSTMVMMAFPGLSGPYSCCTMVICIFPVCSWKG